MNEQTSLYGFAQAIVYKDYCIGCANLFVGGAVDYDGTGSKKNQKWVGAILRMKEDGSTISSRDSMFYMKYSYS